MRSTKFNPEARARRAMRKPSGISIRNTYRAIKCGITTPTITEAMQRHHPWYRRHLAHHQAN